MVSVQSLGIGPVPVAESAGVGYRGFRFDSSTLYLTGYWFEPGLQNIAIAYQAGYAETPTAITQAVIELVALRYRERDRIGHVSKSLGGETVAFIQADMTPSVRAALQPWRRVATV